jgi:hypothetical protein
MGLTKTLIFDDDVLGVLQSMEWSNDGTLGIITGGQLERNLYQRCNKAYDALGGKWDRKAGGIVFKIDPRPNIEGLVTSGELTVERDGFFETPQAVVERMLELVPPDKSNDALTLEPSAGLGAIVRVLIENGVQWMLIIEKNEARAEELRKEFASQSRIVNCRDFLNEPAVTDYPFDRIYMNPPFEELQDVDHVRHAYDLLADGGKMVSVMAESAFFRSDKKSESFREWLNEVNAYVEKLPEGSFKESGTGVNTRLVVIEK